MSGMEGVGRELAPGAQRAATWGRPYGRARSAARKYGFPCLAWKGRAEACASRTAGGHMGPPLRKGPERRAEIQLSMSGVEGVGRGLAPAAHPKKILKTS